MRIFPWISIPSIFLAGTLAGYFLCAQFSAISSEDIYRYSSTTREEGFTYVSPLLMCGIADELESSAYESLKNEVEEAVEPIRKQEDTVSIYFRDLSSGRWFAVDREEKYIPASLLKLPLYIAYLKFSQNNPEILETKGTVSSEDYNLGQNFKSDSPITPGGSYTIRELLTAMIQQSDNNAAHALDALIPLEFKEEVFSDLGVPIPSEDPTEDFITVKDYSHFFRILYNASYLSDADSEATLELLIRNRFQQGIAGVIPPELPIAEKFGERSFLNSETGLTQNELHDCGIVYYPEHPYLLCVMTKSSNSFEHLSEVIQTISKTILDSFASNKTFTQK